MSGTSPQNNNNNNNNNNKHKQQNKPKSTTTALRKQNCSDYEPATLSDFQRTEVFLFSHMINISSVLTELGWSVD